MLNQIVLVGRLVKKPEVSELEDGRKQAHITLAVPRSFKNAEGIYDTDFIDCVLWNSVAENTAEYCKKGDIVGVRGRVQVRTIEDEKTHDKANKMEVVCEKITFLSSKREAEVSAENNLDSNME